jgi:hypothetical protein
VIVRWQELTFNNVGAGLVPARIVRQDDYQSTSISMLMQTCQSFAQMRGGQGQALPLQFIKRHSFL